MSRTLAPGVSLGAFFVRKKGANMEDHKTFSQLFAEAQTEAEKKAAERQEQAFMELGGVARRYWREILKALLEEGVAEDLVEGATADFLSILAASGRGK